jgi:hypothetical protein
MEKRLEVFNLKRKPLKTEVVAFRLTPSFKRVLEQLAANEGLDLSAWMRNLIIKELKSRGIIKESAAVGLTFEEMLLEKAEEGKTSGGKDKIWEKRG